MLPYSHSVIAFYNRGGKCFLRSTKWIFKLSRLVAVVKGLKQDKTAVWCRNVQCKLTRSWTWRSNCGVRRRRRFRELQCVCCSVWKCYKIVLCAALRLSARHTLFFVPNRSWQRYVVASGCYNGVTLGNTDSASLSEGRILCHDSTWTRWCTVWTVKTSR